MIRRAGEVRWISIGSKDAAGNTVVAASHGPQSGGVGWKDGAELSMAIPPGGAIDRGDRQVMDHPPFVPATLVVDDEQAGDVGEYVDERPNVVRIGWQAGLGFKNYPHRAHGRQAAVRASRGEHCRVVHTGYQARKGIRLKAGCIQQVILKELAGFGGEREPRLMSFGVSLSR